MKKEEKTFCEKKLTDLLVSKLLYFVTKLFIVKLLFVFLKETSAFCNESSIFSETSFRFFKETPFYERTSWVQIMKFNKGRKFRDTLPLISDKE